MNEVTVSLTQKRSRGSALPRTLIACIVFAVMSDGSIAAPTAPKLTAEEDHARLMQVLGITSLRPGANPRDPNAPNAPNYDEARANPYPHLPDPLKLDDGTTVSSPAMWHLQRRPQLIEAFDREVYGRVPTSVPHVRWEVTDVTHEKIGAQRALVKHLRGHVNDSAFPTVNVDIEALVAFPEESAKPVPVIMHIGFIKIPPEMQRFAAMDGGKDWREQLLARGWGYLIVVPTSVQADDPAQLTEGIIGLANRGQPRNPDAWGALRAWAWGASRALDYLETDSNADAKRVGIEGLSRYGKAALVAMAYDERFAIGFIGSSGAGGAKLHRRDFGERVENLAGVGAYHWMAGNYMKYAGPLTAKDLPVDAHELVALCAPRPVFISVGAPAVEGQWIDARGMFMATVAAGPVYRLLGKRDLGTDVFPPMETALIDGELAFRQHSGGHTTGPNWPTFIRFASKYFKQRE